MQLDGLQDGDMPPDVLHELQLLQSRHTPRPGERSAGWGAARAAGEIPGLTCRAPETAAPASTVRARPGGLSALTVSHSESVLYGTFVWASGALNSPLW